MTLGRKLRSRRFWLVLAWRAIARLLGRTPRAHPAWPPLLSLSHALEGRYWRQIRRRR